MSSARDDTQRLTCQLVHASKTHQNAHTRKSAVVLYRFVSYPRRFGVREPCQPPTCHCPFNEANNPKWRWGRNQKTPKSQTQCPQQIINPTSKRNKTKATQVYNKATYNNSKKRKRISSFILQTRHSAGEILTTPELQQIRLLKARETKQSNASLERERWLPRKGKRRRRQNRELHFLQTQHKEAAAHECLLTTSFLSVPQPAIDPNSLHLIL